MRFEVLGPLRVYSEHGRVSVPTGKVSAALCWLVASVNESVTLDGLGAILFPHAPDAQARTHQVLRSLARVVEPDALVLRPRAMLRAEESSVDARCFDAWIADARHLQDIGDLASAQKKFEAALGLWRGDPLPELDRDPRAIPIVDHLTENYWTSVEELNAIRLSARVDYAFVGELRSLVVQQADRPRLRNQLAQSLYRTGRQVEALAALDAPGPVDPASEALRMAILRHDEALEGSEFLRPDQDGASKPPGR